MIGGTLKSVLATMTALGFVSFLLIPCLCSTAAAGEIEDEATGCCPFSQDSEPEEEGPEDRESNNDCCSDCASTCTKGAGNGDFANSEAVLQMERELLGELTPQTWWTPQILATLWLVDRLAEADFSPEPIAWQIRQAHPDRSDTYLQLETLLI